MLIMERGTHIIFVLFQFYNTHDALKILLFLLCTKQFLGKGNRTGFGALGRFPGDEDDISAIFFPYQIKVPIFYA